MLESAAREIFGIGGEHVRSAFDEMNAGAAGIDGAEILREGVAADFGERSGEFDPGGARSDDDEVQRVVVVTPHIMILHITVLDIVIPRILAVAIMVLAGPGAAFG